MASLGKIGRFGDKLRTAVGSAASTARSAVASTAGTAATAVGSAANSAVETVADAVVKKTPSEKLLKTLDDNLTLINALPADIADARKALGDRQVALRAQVNALAKKPDKAAVKPLQVDVDKLSGDVSAMSSYAIARAEARALERELKVLNRGASAYEKPITDLLTAADTEVKTDPKAAVTRLKTAGTVVKTQKTLAQTEGDHALADAQYKPLFDDKVRRIRAAITELEALPGTHDARDKLQALIDGGTAAAKPGGFENAYKKLKGLSGTLAAGRKSSEDFPRKAGGPEFAKQLAATETTFDAFSELSAFADPAAVAKYRKQIDDTIKTLEGQPTPDKSTAAGTELARIDTELKAAMAEREKDAGDWARIFPGVEKDLQMVRNAAPADVYGGVLASLRAAETLHGLQDHKEAARQLRKLRSQLGKTLPLYQPQYEKWEELSKVVEKDFRPELERVVNELGMDDLRKVAAPLLTAYTTSADTLTLTHDYAGAVVNAQAVISRFPTDVAPQLKAYDALAERRANSKAGLLEAVAALQVQIDILKAKGGDVAASNAVSSTASSLWNAAARSGTDGKALADAFVTIVDPVNKERERLIKLLADPAQLKSSQDAGTLISRQAELDTATGSARAALARLGAEYPGDAGPLQTRLDAILAGAKAETDAGRPVTTAQIADMNALVAQIGTRQKEHDTAMAAQADKARQASVAAINRVNALRRANPKFAKFFDAVEAEVRDAAAMAGSTVAKVVDASVAQLSAGGDLYDRLTKIEATDFTLPGRIIDDINLYLEDDALKACRPGQRKAFQTRLKKEVLVEAYGSTFDAAVQSLRDFRSEVDTARTEAIKANADREAIKVLAATATTALKKLDKDESPKVYDSLAARIKAAATVTEAREWDSKAKLDALIVIINRLSSGAPDAVDQRVEMEQTLVNNEFQEEQAKAQWLAKIGLYEKNELRLAKAAYDAIPGPLRDAPRMKQLTELESDGRKLAEKGQYREALLRLDAARAAARSLQASPMNADASARGALKAAAQKWKSAVSQFVTELNDLADTIRSQAEADPSVDAAAPDLAAKAVREIAMSFDPLKFDAVIQGITVDGATNLTLRRKQKETALRFVRNYLDTLAGDPLLKHVADNPFKPVPLKSLADRLADLNLNFQRA